MLSKRTELDVGQPSYRLTWEVQQLWLTTRQVS